MCINRGVGKGTNFFILQLESGIVRRKNKNPKSIVHLFRIDFIIMTNVQRFLATELRVLYAARVHGFAID